MKIHFLLLGFLFVTAVVGSFAPKAGWPCAAGHCPCEYFPFTQIRSCPSYLKAAVDACCDETGDGSCPIFAASKDATGNPFGLMSEWDVSKIEKMGGSSWGLFKDKTEFNADLSKWDISRVSDLTTAFKNAVAFNADLSLWDTSELTTLYSSFYNAKLFNSDISKWKLSKLIHLTDTFQQAESFNVDVSKWDVRTLNYMTRAFKQATSFNFKASLDISWASKSLYYDYLPVDLFNAERFDGTCSVSTTCGTCGSSAVTCSASTLPAAAPTALCNGFCPDDSAECCTLPTCSSTNFELSSCPKGEVLNDDLNIECQTLACTALDCCRSPFFRPLGRQPLMKALCTCCKETPDGSCPLFAASNDITTGHPYGLVGDWSLSKVTSLSNLLASCRMVGVNNSPSVVDVTCLALNADVSKWDVSNVVELDLLFDGTTQFNQDLSAWNTKKVTSLYKTFYGAQAFNGDISTWLVGCCAWVCLFVVLN